MFEEIDTTIESVEKLYRAVSGREAGETEPSPLPPEKDASKHVEDQLDRLLTALASMASMAQSQAVTPPKEQPAWAPPVCILEHGQELNISIDLPGVPREQVTVTATPLLISITGQRPAAVGAVASAEMPRGAFRRDIALPPGVFVSDLTATLKDGVLELRVPRAVKPAPRPISVQ